MIQLHNWMTLPLGRMIVTSFHGNCSTHLLSKSSLELRKTICTSLSFPFPGMLSQFCSQFFSYILVSLLHSSLVPFKAIQNTGRIFLYNKNLSISLTCFRAINVSARMFHKIKGCGMICDCCIKKAFSIQIHWKVSCC